MPSVKTYNQQKKYCLDQKKWLTLVTDEAEIYDNKNESKKETVEKIFHFVFKKFHLKIIKKLSCKPKSLNRFN